MTDNRLRKRVAFIEQSIMIGDDYDHIASEFAVIESTSTRVRSAIAAKLNVPSDCVVVSISEVNGKMAIASATVHMDGPTAVNMLNDGIDDE